MYYWNITSHKHFCNLLEKVRPLIFIRLVVDFSPHKNYPQFCSLELEATDIEVRMAFQGPNVWHLSMSRIISSIHIIRKIFSSLVLPSYESWPVVASDWGPAPWHIPAYYPLNKLQKLYTAPEIIMSLPRLHSKGICSSTHTSREP